MQNLNSILIQKDDIVTELEELFENTPTLCLKQNASGWGNNQRIVFVKDKMFYYARKYAQFQNGLTTEIPPQYIKSSVRLEDIYEVKYIPIDKSPKRTLCLLFPQKRINQQQLTQNNNPNMTQSSVQIVEVKDEQNEEQENIKMIRWNFYFSFDLKQKLQRIRAIKRQQLKQKSQLLPEQDDLEDQNPDQKQNILNNSLDNEQIALKQYVDQLRKAKDYIKFKQNRQKMQKIQRRKSPKTNQQKSRQYVSFSNQQQNYPIMSHWRPYFSALQDIIMNKNPDRTVYECELILYKQIHRFKEQCIDIFKNYIFEKIGAINNEKYRFSDFYFYKGIWIKIGDKELNQQFMMYYLVADLTHLLNKNHRPAYRVPDICLIDYLGFKALCMCDLPFSQIDKTQVYNLFSETYDLQNITKIKTQLSLIEKALNLKNQDTQKLNKRIPAPLGNSLRIFQYNPKKDIKIDHSTIQPFYYLTNLNNIFPLDFNFQVQQPNLGCRFRPELIGDIRQILQLDYDENTQLLSTAFMVSGLSQQQKTLQDDKVVKTAKFLIKERIPEFAQKLNNCELIIVDSYSLKFYMSEFGINMRYMYRIHNLAKITYLREVIEVQCLARTIKSIFNEAMRQLTNSIHISRKIERQNEYNQFQLQKNEAIHLSNQQKFKEDEVKIIENTIDFLNLVFGNGRQTVQFWKILCEKTFKKFQVKVGWPFSGSAGSLLHAVLYNCGIQADFSVDIPLFKTEAPFSVSNSVHIQPKTKTLDYPSFETQKLIRSVPDIESNDHQNIQLLNQIALKLFKMDVLKNYYLFDGQNNFHLSFSKINLVKEEMQKSRHLSPHHPSQISYYISNKSQLNFEKGLKLMTFCYSDYHPMFISFYQQYSKVYQPELLKKSAILQSIKCFGQFHPRTSQMYSGSFGDGFKQFYQKSLRSEGILSSKTNIIGQFKAGKYLSCMEYCLKQMKMSQKNDARVKRQNCLQYLEILFMGMKAALQIRRLEEALQISDAISNLLNIFKLRNYQYHYQLVKETLRAKLILTPQKLFFYKLALLCINTRQKFKQPIKKDQMGRVPPAEGEQKQILATGIMNEYFSHDTHALWLNNIFKHLMASFQYFNHLEDLFNNFEYHLGRYNNSLFVDSLGYWDILVRLYGEDMFRNYLYETGSL